MFPFYLTILGKFSEKESKERFIWWKFLCELLLLITFLSSLTMPFMLTMLFSPNLGRLLSLTNISPELSNVCAVWGRGLSLLFNLLINTTVLALMGLSVNFLIIFLFPTAFLLGEIR